MTERAPQYNPTVADLINTGHPGTGEGVHVGVYTDVDSDSESSARVDHSGNSHNKNKAHGGNNRNKSNSRSKGGRGGNVTIHIPGWQGQLYGVSQPGQVAPQPASPNVAPPQPGQVVPQPTQNPNVVPPQPTQNPNVVPPQPTQNPNVVPPQPTQNPNVVPPQPTQNPNVAPPQPANPNSLQVINYNLYNDLEDAQDRYALLTAENRGAYIGRFRGRLGGLVSRIPGIKGRSESRDRDIQDAITAYRAVVDQAITEVIDHHRRAGATPDQLDMIRRTELIGHDVGLEARIVAQRESLAVAHGGAGKFTTWWVNSGRLKKAAAILAAGAAAGAVVATGGAALGVASVFGVSLGGLAGGATGAGITHRVTQRRANAIYESDNKEGANAGETVAAHRSRLDHTDKENRLAHNPIRAIGGVIVDRTEHSSDDEMRRNRRRVRVGESLGFAAGSLAGVGVHALYEAFDGSNGYDAPSLSQAQNHTAAPPPHTSVNPGDGVNTPPHPNLFPGDGVNTPPHAHLNPGDSLNTPPHTSVNPGDGLSTSSSQFTVHSGDGYTSVLKHAYNIKGGQAWNLHKALVDHFGEDYIHINGLHGHDVYSMGPSKYLEGLASPGKANFDPGVAKYAADWLSTHSVR